MSPCSARLRYGRDLSFECWDLRSNVVVGRASLCARSFVVKDLSLLTTDVSVAFMHAPVEAEACNLVLLPANLTIKGCRVIAWLGKAMNGLRRAPLLWFLELQRVVYSMGGQDTFENTLFRLQTPNGMLLVLVYVDDLLVAAESPQEGESFLQQLQTIWRIKLTGRIPALKKGVLQFLGRTSIEKGMGNPP